MAQIFTVGRSVFFFCWKFFTHKSGMPTSTFQEQGTVTLVASLPEERRCQSTMEAACVGRLATCVRVTSSSSLSRASSPWPPLDRFRRWCETRHGAGLLLLRQVSGVKCEACNSKTRYLQAQPATRGILVHVQKTSSAKRLLVRGEADIQPLASP